MHKLKHFYGTTLYEKICALFLDETSREIYDNLIQLNDTNNTLYLEQAIASSGYLPHPSIAFHRYLRQVSTKGGREVILYGCGQIANYLFDLAKSKKDKMGYLHFPMITDIEWTAFCDKSVQTDERFQPFISFETLVKYHQNALIVVTTPKHFDEIANELNQQGIPKSNIILYQPGETAVFEERQYFDQDFITAQKETFVIDGGCFKCDTVERFLSWNKGYGYDGILSFEPDPINYQNCKQLAAELDSKIEIIHAGLSDKQEKLIFTSCGNDESCFSQDGNCSIQVTTIDECIQNRPASLIKLDVEGFELAALKGAERTIILNRPNILVCAYHKAEDLIQLPEYLAQLNCGYRFHLRVYSNQYLEIVLYAIPKEKKV